MARDRTIVALGQRGIDSADPDSGHLVCGWSDLWAEILAEAAEDRAPAPASPFAARSLFHKAVRIAKEAGTLGDLTTMLELPGFRRQLLGRFASWTLKEFPREADAPPVAVSLEEWALYLTYRELLDRLAVEDEAGLTVWASRYLVSARPRPLSRFRQVTFLDFDPSAVAHWRVLEHAVQHVWAVRATLPFAPSPSREELYDAIVPTRERLRGLGFSETRVEPDVWRPSGLRDTEARLFCDRSVERPGDRIEPIRSVGGLAIRGAPQGDALARVVARDVRRLLSKGILPDEILILFRQWTPQAELILEMLKNWEIPAWGVPRRGLDGDSAVAALLGGIRIPAEDWETDGLVRLLRHGQVRPGEPGIDPAALAMAASAIKGARVFRGGPDLIRRAIGRAAAGELRNETQKRRAIDAQPVVEWILRTLERLDRRRPWAAQVDQMLALAETLGLTRRTESTRAIDQLRDALEEYGDLAARLDRSEADRPWSWAEFSREVARIASEITLDQPETPVTGCVRLALVDEARGVGSKYVFLTDLEEGTFPTREAVEPFLALRPGETPGAVARLAYSRESLRFLGVFGAAEQGIALYYPTTDAKGQEILRSGFLDDLITLLDPEAERACHESTSRVDPALIDRPDLAGSPADRRLRAIASARESNDPGELTRLSVDPCERKILEGVVAAIGVQKRRAYGSPFGEFDGLLRDGSAILSVGDQFHPDFLFSPSQLETYIGCPFQFFAKYVMKLNVLDDRDELGEDFTDRGSRIHDLLENLEKYRIEFSEASVSASPEQVALNDVLAVDLADSSDVDRGLRAIEDRRLERVLKRYKAQLRDYQANSPALPVPHGFEVKFGNESAGNAEKPSFPPLEVGRGRLRVKLQGMIDRIDVLESPEGRLFRVIDYKTGAGPTPTDVKTGHMLQLPLYALAVERHILADEGIRLLDVGYWGLKKDGYRPIRFEGWLDDQDLLESYVVEIVQKLREGAFPVNSRKTGCEGFCEFRAICRVRQVRAARKEPGDAIVPAISLKASAVRLKKQTQGRTPPPEQPASEGAVRVAPLAADPADEVRL